MSEALPDGGEVVVLVSNLTKYNAKERTIGLNEAIDDLATSDEEAGIEVVDFLTDDGSRQTCEDNIRKAIGDHPNLAGFIAMNGYHGPILLDVLRAEAKLADIKLVTFDVEVATLAGVEAGEIHGTIAQDPYMYGYEAVRMLTRLRKGKHIELPIVGGGAISVACDPIRKDGVATLRERLEQRLKGKPESDGLSKAAGSAE